MSCKELEGVCYWYTWYPDETCLLFTDCDVDSQDDDCEGCISGEEQCSITTVGELGKTRLYRLGACQLSLPTIFFLKKS